MTYNVIVHRTHRQILEHTSVGLAHARPINFPPRRPQQNKSKMHSPFFANLAKLPIMPMPHKTIFSLLVPPSRVLQKTPRGRCRLSSSTPLFVKRPTQRTARMLKGNMCNCCPGTCDTRRCPCRKQAIDCSSHCHKGKDCTN